MGEVNSVQQHFFDLDVMENSMGDPYDIKQKRRELILNIFKTHIQNNYEMMDISA